MYIHAASPPAHSQPSSVPAEGTHGPQPTIPIVVPDLQEIIRHAGTSVEALNQECAPCHPVLKKLANCCFPVNMIGPYLQLEDHEVQDIVRAAISAEEQRVAMLQKWQNKFLHKATYLVLVQALVDCGKNKQAADVCKIFVQDIGSGKSIVQYS